MPPLTHRPNRIFWERSFPITLLLITIICVFLLGGNLGSAQDTGYNLEPLSSVMFRTGIQAWRDAGYSGAGVKIGVIDPFLTVTDELVAEYGNDVNGQPILTDLTLSNSNIVSDLVGDAIRHGLDVIEIIHTIAPDARIFACEYEDITAFTQCVQSMDRQGVDIINHSAGVAAQPLNGDNLWARNVQTASNAGILWINSAGNYGRGFLQTNFTDLDPENTNQLSAYHDFPGVSDATHQRLEVLPVQNASYRTISLSWGDFEGFAAELFDLDLEIVDFDGNRIAQSVSDQPLEVVRFATDNPFYIRIYDKNRLNPRASGITNPNAVSLPFYLHIEFANIQSFSPGSVVAPADHRDALTVGALSGQNVAAYSSRRLPGNSAGIKPDLSAPGEIYLSNGRSFIGTSAAAPVVAAASALVLSADLTRTRESLRAFFTTIGEGVIDDLLNPGLDLATGYGYLSLRRPIILDTPTPTLIPTQTYTPSPTATATATVDLFRVGMDIIASVTAAQATATPSNTPTATPENAIAQTLRTVNMRAEPEISSQVIATMPEGTLVTIRGITEDYRWYFVNFNGISGWIAVDDNFVQTAGNLNIVSLITPTATFTNTPQPCTLRALEESVPVRSGPGFNRGVRQSLPTNMVFSVVGRALDREGNVWWLLQTNPPSSDDNRYWTLNDSEQVQVEGDCNLVIEIPPSDLIPIPTYTPTPTHTPTQSN